MNRFNILWLGLILSYISGCASYSTLQTAEVLGEDETMVIVALSRSGNSEPDADASSYTTPEIMMRTPVSRNFDMGAKIYGGVPINIVLDGKYQFYNGNKFDMAIDLGIGYNEIGDLRYTDIYPALLFSYKFSNSFGITLAPKKIIRQIENGTPTSQEWTGGTISFFLGKKTKFIPEFGSYESDLGYKVNTFSVGMIW